MVNQPTGIEGNRVIVSRLQGGGVSIDVMSQSGPMESERMSVGDEATLSGFTFTLIVVDVDDSVQPAGETGGDRTTAWILPATD